MSAEAEAGIRLIVGLGNPGAEYAQTRHNVGAWFVARLAESSQVTLRSESKFQGTCGALTIGGVRVWLLTPSTYMNHSGRSVAAFMQFYRLQPQHVLVVHDELDLPPGTIRFKTAGGHGGHNGLRDIIAALGSSDFHRLRVGIGHPGHRDAVVGFVLGVPSVADREAIISSFMGVDLLLPDMVAGEFNRVQKQLHTAG